MRRSSLYKVLAIFFALYLPLITVGLPLHKHYCQGNLEHSQWIFETESCHEKALKQKSDSCCGAELNCHEEKQNLPKYQLLLICCGAELSHHQEGRCNDQLSDRDCCENEVELFKFDQSLIKANISHFKYKSLDVNFVFSLPEDIFVPKPYSVYRIKSHDHFHPYPNGQSRLVFFQSFLC